MCIQMCIDRVWWLASERPSKSVANYEYMFQVSCAIRAPDLAHDVVFDGGCVASRQSCILQFGVSVGCCRCGIDTAPNCIDFTNQRMLEALKAFPSELCIWQHYDMQHNNHKLYMLSTKVSTNPIFTSIIFISQIDGIHSSLEYTAF